MAKLSLVVLLLLMAAGCGTKKPDDAFARMAEEFVYTSLSFSPISATQSGLHKYKGQNLDEMLDDVSAAAVDRQRKYYEDFRARMGEVRRSSLSPEWRADYDIIAAQVGISLLEIDEIRNWQHNPTQYVELAGNALFNPMVLEYAPKAERFGHIIARLQKLPLFLDQARTNLASSPSVWTKVAMEENAGNIDLVDKTLRAAVPADQKAAFDAAAAPALEALRGFQDFLKKSLSVRTGWDWRLGRDKYHKKFLYVLSSGTDPESVLQAAETELESVRKRMTELALKLTPGGNAPAEGDTEGQNRLIAAALDRVAARHSTPETYIADARADLEEARKFVEAKHLLTLPPGGNLQVIETPEFMRGIYGVGGFNPAPTLEPKLGAFYWVTPIPASWPKARVESKLREYNFYKLKLLTIHEAMPGHYVQFEYANAIQPETRRLVRALFGSGPYVEGWAQFATEQMLDSGFLGNPPEMQLTFDKERLRVLANAILDVRLQVLGMSDQEALDLMEKRTFQEKEEAEAKLQRAQLSSCQLPTYFVGWRGWKRVRDNHAKLSSADFNDRALKQGAVPLEVLDRLLRGE